MPHVWNTTGPEGEPQASVQPGDGAAVQPLPQTGQVQEAALRPLLLPLRVAGTQEVPHAGLEHRLRVQRLRL